MNENLSDSNITEAVDYLKKGRIIAYPTEAVYGLGCDPFNPTAVAHLRSIKNRSISKGFILIASEWQQISSWIKPINPEILDRMLQSWPGPITWVLPIVESFPRWLRGDDLSVAVRVTAHPIAHALCEAYQSPIVSTSANRESEIPIRDFQELKQEFEKEVDFFVPGALGGADRPSEIREALTGKILRK